MKALALLGAVAVLGLAQVPANAAAGGAFCARENGGDQQYEDCSYASFQQCRMATIGVGGLCVRNPYYARRGAARVWRQPAYYPWW